MVNPILFVSLFVLFILRSTITRPSSVFFSVDRKFSNRFVQHSNSSYYNNADNAFVHDGDGSFLLPFIIRVQCIMFHFSCTLLGGSRSDIFIYTSSIIWYKILPVFFSFFSYGHLSHFSCWRSYFCYVLNQCVLHWFFYICRQSKSTANHDNDGSFILLQIITPDVSCLL